MKQQQIFEVLIEVINNMKNTGYSTENIGMDYYLGGDLGIDSVELLEIWYDFEQALNVKVPDSEKRDLYTLEDVVKVAEANISSVVNTQNSAAQITANFDYDEVVMSAQ